MKISKSTAINEIRKHTGSTIAESKALIAKMKQDTGDKRGIRVTTSEVETAIRNANNPPKVDTGIKPIKRISDRHRAILAQIN